MQDEQDIVRAIVKVALTFDSPESRASYLATACQDDTAMLERVERLLAAYCTTMTVQPPSTGNGDDRPTLRGCKEIGQAMSRPEKLRRAPRFPFDPWSMAR